MSSLARRASIALEAAVEDDMLDGGQSSIPVLSKHGNLSVRDSFMANPAVSAGVGLGQEGVAASTSGRGGAGSAQGNSNFDIMTAQVIHSLTYPTVITFT